MAKSVKRLLRRYPWAFALGPPSMAVAVVVGLILGTVTHDRWIGVVAVLAIALSSGVLAGTLDAGKKFSAANLETPSVTPDSLEHKMELLLESMRQSATLVEQVSAELDARALTVKRLQEDAESARALAEVNKDQAEAVQRIIQSGMGNQLKATRRDIFRDSVRLAIISFLAGGVISLLVTLLVHPLH